MHQHTCAIIFSKDRALQLEATLRSFYARCAEASQIQTYVIYTTSGAPYQPQYDELIKDYPRVTFVRESNFREDFLRIIRQYEKALFVVDDNIFIRDFRLDALSSVLDREPRALGASLRLGQNTVYFYMGETHQNVPPFRPHDTGAQSFRWVDAEHDFAYPLEVSSSLYRCRDLLPWLEQCAFQNPNTLEQRFAEAVPRFRDTHPELLCFESSVAFCAPINKVQRVWEHNKAGSDKEMTPEALAALFDQGKRIDVDALLHFVPCGCHQEIELPGLREAPQTRIAASGYPLVSVVIPCFKYAAYLGESVGSIVEQNYPNIEIIIVNDESPDNTSEVARQLIAKYADRKIELIEQANSGPAIARNSGAARARGDWILPLDADDMFLPHAVSRLMMEALGHPLRSLVTCGLQKFGAERGGWIPDEYTPARLRSYNTFLYSSLYKKSLWQKAGGYSGAVPWGVEDYDFWLSCSENGAVASIAKEPLLLYRTHDQGNLYKDVLASQETMLAMVRTRHARCYSPQQLFQDHEKIAAMPEKLSTWLGKALTRYPRDWQLWFWSALRETHPSQAINFYQKALELCDDHASWQVLLRLLPLLDQEVSKAKEMQDRARFEEVFQIYDHALPRAKAVLPKVGALAPQPKDNLKVVFYYDGIHNSDLPHAGSALATLTLASQLKKVLPQADIECISPLITRPEEYMGISLRSLPPEAEREQYLAAKDIFIVSTSLSAFKNVPKSPRTSWILYEHCWGFADEELSRAVDFDAVIAVSGMHAQFIQSLGALPERVHVVSNSIDTDIFYPRPVPRLPNSIMFAGAVVPHKNVHLLIHAFALLKNDFPDLSVHIFGDSQIWQADDSYERELKNLNAPDVHFYGAVTPEVLADGYSRCSIFCLPSSLESFGLVTVEAQACGCVPVVHATGGTPATLRDRETGLLYSPNNAEALAQTLRQALHSVAADTEVRQRAQQYASSVFSRDNQTAMFLSVLNKIGILPS